MSDLSQRVVLATGGTGGHVFPAFALAQELSSRGFEVVVFSDGRGQQFTNAAIQTIEIPASQLQGSLTQKMKGGFRLMQGIRHAHHYLRKLRPSIVVGFGGYASFPTMSAACLMRFPTIVHQADAYFGRVNRKLAPFVTRIATSFPRVDNIPISCQSKVSFTGLPVRSDIKPSPYVSSEESKPFDLLVMGGSQGARVFSDVVPQAVALLEENLQKRLKISQQCRSELLEMTKALYQNTKAKVELEPFLENMGNRYQNAHLVLSRSGASSVVETALVGRPGLFVPYPYAMDDHQFYNAQQAAVCGGGWLVREKDFTINKLSNILSDLMTSPWKLEQAVVNIQSIAIPDATQRLANLVEETAIRERN
jgi:UDP-N-acetylglucosamine--N-acetylmuramyl-(pentapeptide) pyrophosphoryl-undecaprenol N-acetylglucosamine transferase